MGVIHQLYATHCTYGSSAIERRTTGDSKDRVLGYSARASSFSQSELRRHFRTIERFLYYYLPKETPPEKKQSLTPQAAPHRLFFCPSLSGLQALGYISYRPMDRANRVGSYFAHVLAAPTAANESSWDVLECLQLWNAPGWVVEDLDTFSYDLPTLDKLSDLRGRTQPTAPAVDERVLWSFLNTPPGGPFHCPGPLLLPERWKQMSVADRRRYFRLALMGYLEVSSKERESLLLLVEPSVAVLFFYGIARLLPAGLRTQLSFSTFETNADRLVTTLAALTFDDERSGGDIPPERYRRGFVINTWRDQKSELSDPNAKYADFVLASIVGVPEGKAADLGHAIDQKLARFQQAESAKASDLEEFVKVHDVAEAILRLAPNVSHEAWKKSEKQTAYVRKAIRQKLSGPVDAAFLTRILNSPQYLQIMLETAVQVDDDDNCTPSLNYLVERVQPLDQLAALLGAGVGARRYKLHGLLHYVKTHHRLPGTGPGGCRWLWTEKTPAGRGPHKPPLLLDLLQSSGVDAQLVRDSLDAVPDEGLPLLFRGLLKASLDQSDRNDLLTRIAGRPGFDVIALINEIKSDLGTHGALLASILFEPLKKALDHVHEQPGRFGEIASALEAAKSLLDTPTASRASAWVQLKRTFDKNQQEMATQQAGLKPRIVSGGKIWAFTDKVCECLDRCFPFDPYDAFRRDNFKKFGAFVRHAAASHQLGQLLPEADKFDNYLMASFRGDEKSKKRIANRGFGAWVRENQLLAAGIGVGVLILLMAVFVLARIREERGPVAQTPATQQGTGKDGSSTPKEPKPKAKPPDAPATPPGAGKGAEKSGDGAKQPGEGDAAKSPDAGTKDAAPSAEPGKDSRKDKVGPEVKPAEGAGQAKSGTGAAAPATQGAAENPKMAPKDAKSKPAGAQAEPSKEPPETVPAGKTPASGPAAEKVPAIQALAARKPKNHAFDRPGEAAVEIFDNLASGVAPFRLHGTKLAQEIPLDKQKADAFGANDFGEFQKLEPQVAKNAMSVSARFKSQKFPLASFHVNSAGSLFCLVDKYDVPPAGFDPRIELQKRALKYCVLELSPVQNPPRLVALTKPVAASFVLDQNSGVHVQEEIQGLKPNIPPWGQLYLGQGKFVHPDGEFEFGQPWLQETPRENWPVPKLAQTLGFAEDATVELTQGVGDQVRVSLRMPEPKIDRRPMIEENKKRQEQKKQLNDRKRKVTGFLKGVRARNETSVQLLAKELELAGELPSAPTPPPPFDAKLQFNKQAVHDYKGRLDRYDKAVADRVSWIQDKLIPAGERQIKSLDEQIKELDAEPAQPAEPAAQDDGSNKLKEWLKSRVELRAYIYRLVPYEAPNDKREIRVLVVEPLEPPATPDLKMTPTAG